jgi:hypothetical protein
MTPLAQAILNDSILPKAKQRLIPNGVEWPLVSDLASAKCFELSAVSSLFLETGWRMLDHEAGGDRMRDSRFAFLPAPMTWLEWKYSPVEGETDVRPQRHGALLFETDNLAAGVAVIGYDDGPIVIIGNLILHLLGHQNAGAIMSVPASDPAAPPHWIPNMTSDIHVALAMINTPRIIGRRQHMPHAGLQRKLAAARGMVGKFPLQAWTEIILEVTPPQMDDGEPHEARLTGGKALHFCRSHLRVRRGQLELVKAHWRGDPALGIKRSRYSVVPRKNAA